jgi:hypothetical protein
MPFLAPDSAFLTPLGDTWRWYSLIAAGPVNLGLGVVLGLGFAGVAFFIAAIVISLDELLVLI